MTVFLVTRLLDKNTRFWYTVVLSNCWWEERLCYVEVTKYLFQIHKIQKCLQGEKACWVRWWCLAPHFFFLMTKRRITTLIIWFLDPEMNQPIWSSAGIAKHLVLEYKHRKTHPSLCTNPDLQLAVLLLASRCQWVQSHRGLRLQLCRPVLHHHVHDATAVDVGIECGAPRRVHGGLLLLVHLALFWKKQKQ